MAVDIAAIRKKLESINNQTGGQNNSNIQLWKPNVGNYVIRAMHWPDSAADQPFKELWFYYNIGDRAILAPAQFDKPDPIDDMRRKLFSDGTPDSKAMAKQLFPKMRAYLPLVLREENGKKVGTNEVLVWSFGKLVYQRLLTFFLKDDIQDFLDPYEGFDLEVSITNDGKKRFNDTSIDVARRPSPLSKDPEEVKKILAAVPDIMDMYKLKSAEEIERTLNSWVNGDQEPDNSPGTSKGAASTDALDDLADSISEKKDEKEKAPKPAKKAPPAEKKEAKVEEVEDELEDMFKELESE